MSPTAIEWTDETWNPVTGCSKVSPGCAHCYAETLTERFAGRPGYIEEHRPWTPENAEHNVCLHPERLEQPFHWRKPRMVFVNSMSDLFHELIPEKFVWECIDVMRLAPQHTFQVLTKRPERALEVVSRYYQFTARGIQTPQEVTYPLSNIWVGVSIENSRFTWRADVLREIPAAIRFISAEPLLDSLFRTDRNNAELDLTSIDWLIVGGESGREARPMHPDWARELRDAALATRRCSTCDGQGWTVESGSETSYECCGETLPTGECCAAVYGGDRMVPVQVQVPIQAECRDCYHGERVGSRGEPLGTRFFFKQWGEWAPADQCGVKNVKMSQHRFQYESRRFAPDGTTYRADEPDLYSYPGMESLLRVGKKRAGRLLDGREWNEIPGGPNGSPT